ncbi:hypothetical protein L211DRAFT_619841 [Terfezia boudieri ATCC MYA-4762]|uniref:Uncharacterized protein n=1 Tax=Terfezia boudieri ATCC MYA-4762 TaxID=1051890 RepID=A0A3N4LDK2_9PEZI|nr:hypothetical protein L211DRAFT_619841 [Terfezia boudieri ATCC MYA-4762]
MMISGLGIRFPIRASSLAILIRTHSLNPGMALHLHQSPHLSFTRASTQSLRSPVDNSAALAIAASLSNTTMFALYLTY